MQKGTALVKRPMLVRTQSSALVTMNEQTNQMTRGCAG